MNPETLQELKLDPSQKARPKRFVVTVLLGVAVLSGLALYWAWPSAEDERRVVQGSNFKSPEEVAAQGGGSVPSRAVEGSVLTVSGYIVNKERIELSPRFLGVVRWIGVKKGDTVTNGQVVVLLDDSEQKARMQEAEGRLAQARANAERAQLHHDRVMNLGKNKIESQHAQDEARLQLASARAILQEAEGHLALARTHLEWTVIRSPIDGVVLEKLVDPNELVVPQSFGGPRGPSTALIALANPQELQVEIDLNESDLPRVFLNQPCQVSPEAYPDRVYAGYVAEIAPEANRQKGTLQVKVQVREPDRFLTPELSARVDFIGSQPDSPGATAAGR